MYYQNETIMKNTFTIPTNKKAGENYIIKVELDNSKFLEIIDIVAEFSSIDDFYNAEKQGLFKII